VYYPEKTSRVVVGSLTGVGIFLGLLFSELIGAGLAAGAVTKESWKDALAIGPGSLMVEAFAPLGGFGKFCAVLLALGTVSNIIPGIYSSPMAWQIFSRGCENVPRAVWTVSSFPSISHLSTRRVHSQRSRWGCRGWFPGPGTTPGIARGRTSKEVLLRS
jgi:purine-cytosine permease-like protein